MVAQQEVEEDAAQALGHRRSRNRRAIRDGRQSSSTDHVADGPVTLTAHVAVHVAGARAAGGAPWPVTRRAEDVVALGEGAYGTDDGLVVVREDGFVRAGRLHRPAPGRATSGPRRSTPAIGMARSS